MVTAAVVVAVLSVLLQGMLVRVSGNVFEVSKDRVLSSSNCIKISDQPEPVAIPATENVRKKTIMWLDIPRYGHGLRNSYKSAQFDTCIGTASNCELLPHVISLPHISANQNISIGPFSADAVLIMGSHLARLPTIIRRDENQVFVFAERENIQGIHTFFQMEHEAVSALYKEHTVLFNWTMTFRQDSDILFPYGHVIPNRNPTKHPPKYFNDIFHNKKYDIVWFVSHCATFSLREHYVAELQKFIDVHIYGACGNYSCRNFTCLQQVIKDYKFVLSFENTYYPNYVTEKLFDWFNRDIVQVVRGGGIDYSSYGLPNGSVIDADDFGTPRDLAECLKRLGNDKEEYIGYLKRKNSHTTVPMTSVRTAAYCNLCARLNDINRFRKSYNHIGAWFSSKPFHPVFCPGEFT